MKTAVIVGGGVIGLSVAYHLARRKFGRVVVVEKDRLGSGASGRAAGIATGLLWSETGIRARQLSLRLFRELSRELPGYVFHDEEGCLNLFSPESWPGRAALLPLYDRLNAPYHVLSPKEISRRWPALLPPPDFLGLHDPLGGFSEPPEYIEGLARAAAALGVEICEGERVVGWDQADGAIRGVRTTRAHRGADAVIVTAHVWTLPTLAGLPVRPPAKHFVHQRFLSRPLRSRLALPPVNADPFLGYLRPASGNRLLVGVETPDSTEWKVDSLDFDLKDLPPRAGLCEQAVGRMSSLLPELADAAWESEKVGLISFSLDGEPILGPVPAIPGLYLGQAFHSGGFAYNPAAGFLLAEWVAEGTTSLDISAFLPNRFARDQADAYLATEVTQSQAVRRRH